MFRLNADCLELYRAQEKSYDALHARSKEPTDANVIAARSG